MVLIVKRRGLCDVLCLRSFSIRRTKQNNGKLTPEMRVLGEMEEILIFLFRGLREMRMCLFL